MRAAPIAPLRVKQVMTDNKALKIVPPPEAKGKPEAASEQATARSPRKSRRSLRMILLVVLPLIALIAGGIFYLSGGRYIETDNAYVGAQKVLITPDVSGQIVQIAVREGQHVNPGDELFALDKKPFQLAVDAARAKLATARADYDKLKATLGSLTTLIQLANKSVELKQRDYERKAQLAKSSATSQADVDNAAAAVVTAQLQAQLAEQQRVQSLSQLSGDANLPLEKFPEYAQAQSAVDNAERDLAHTVVRAPISGIATQVDNIQLGRFVAAGGPVFSVIDDAQPWVDANPKETDITYLRVGETATLDVDSFPNHTFHGHVVSVSPGTGAQFSILPPQNASGNWVKVVQRVPVRIAFDKDDFTGKLRAGMSVNVSIDTHHSRWPSWLGGAQAQEADAK
jgi:membrane fusion protein (multidrug efflux system)